jgi:metallophosphoesterase (TIGR00282 family)
MRIMFVGDVVGRPGRQICSQLIPKLRTQYGVDLVLANGENAAGGFGITPRVLEELLSSGIDIVTSGNHIWDRKEIYEVMDKEERLLRPLNYPPGVPGRGSCLVNCKGKEVGVINVQGRVFMDPIDCPFRTIEPEVDRMRGKTNIIVVDMHGEATSEKMAMGWFLDGKVSCVIGTHTHVQTADERILPGGTAYITDVGMTGPSDTIIGLSRGPILRRFLTHLPERWEVGKGDPLLCGVLVDISEETGKAESIKRIKVKEAGDPLEHP